MKHMFDYVRIKKQYFTKADRLLILGVLILSVILAFFFLTMGLHRDMAVAVIEQDGREILRLSLDEERTVRIPCDNGFNVIETDGQSVYVSEADCPDQICVRQGKISGSRESIVCLPHRLLIRLEGSKDSGLDAMTN